MKNFLIISLFCAIFLLIDAKYEIIFDRNESVLGDKEKMFDMGTSRMRKYNRSTAVLSGTFSTKQPIDNTMMISFDAFNLAGGQYKKLFGRTVGPACDVFYDPGFEKEMKRFLSYTNITVAYGTCPFPASIIHVENYTIEDLGDFLPPYIPGHERWKVSVYFSKDDEVLGGITNYAILRDEQKLFDSKFGK